MAADPQPARQPIGSAPLREVPELQGLSDDTSLVAAPREIGTRGLDRLAVAERAELDGVLPVLLRDRTSPPAWYVLIVVIVFLNTATSPDTLALLASLFIRLACGGAAPIV